NAESTSSETTGDRGRGPQQIRATLRSMHPIPNGRNGDASNESARARHYETNLSESPSPLSHFFMLETTFFAAFTAGLGSGDFSGKELEAAGSGFATGFFAGFAVTLDGALEFFACEFPSVACNCSRKTMVR